MDERNLPGRHTTGHELAAQVIINRELPGCSLRRGDVAEHKLRQLLRFAFTPDAQDIFSAAVDFAAGVIGEHGIDDSLVETQLAPIAGDFEHIVDMGVHLAAVDFACPLGQLLYHGLLMLGGLAHDIVILHFRRGQVQLVCGLDVGNLFEQVHQLREIKEPGKPCPCPVARALRRQFQCGDGLSKAGGPAVELLHLHFLQLVIL